MNTLIFLGGEKPSHKLAYHAAQRANLIIAADSGYLAISETEIKPDVVTGDFDSIGEIPLLGDFKLIPAPQQDATDFQKALRHVPPEGESVEILGGTGLRSDHFLTNLLIAASLPESISVVFHDDTQSIYRVTPHFSLSLNVQPGTIVSLIPFAACRGVVSSGFHWNLENAKMGPSDQLGQSNCVDLPQVSIRIAAGTLYVVVNHPNGFS